MCLHTHLEEECSHIECNIGRHTDKAQIVERKYVLSGEKQILKIKLDEISARLETRRPKTSGQITVESVLEEIEYLNEELELINLRDELIKNQIQLMAIYAQVEALRAE